jgi:tetratricopeptide (TPR) repeat protein
MLKFFKLVLLAVFLSASFTKISAQTPTAKDFFEQGVNFLKQQKPAEALDAFQRSARLEPNHAATHGNIGTILVLLNRVGESIAPFREAVRLAPNESLFRVGLCRSLSLMKNHAEAVAQCEEAVKSGDNLPETHVALIAALRATKQNAEAARRAEIAVQKFAGNEILLVAAAETFAADGNFPRTLEIYETLARLKPNSAAYQVGLAEYYLRLERDAEAIAAARKAIELEPRHPLAHFFLGRVYFELGQHEEAAVSFQKSIEFDQKFADAFYFLGLAQARRSKFDQAITALREAARLAPDNFYYNNELGKILNDDKKFEEAIEYFRRAERINSNDFENKTGLGLALMSSAKFSEALEFFAQADRLKPGHPVVQMFLNVARARQQSAGQIEALKQYVVENPKNIEARKHLTEMLVYLRRTKEALAAIEELIPLLPPTNKNLTHIGVLYDDLGMNEKAVEFHRKAIAAEPHYVIYMSLAGNLKDLGRKAEVYEAYKKAIELKSDSASLFKVYADFLRDEGKRQEAIEMYKRAVALEPTNSPALFNLGILHAKIGNLDAARQYYETLRAVDPAQARILNRFLRLR